MNPNVEATFLQWLNNHVRWRSSSGKKSRVPLTGFVSNLSCFDFLDEEVLSSSDLSETALDVLPPLLYNLVMDCLVASVVANVVGGDDDDWKDDTSILLFSNKSVFIINCILFLFHMLNCFFYVCFENW